MISSPIPHNEEARLKELDELGILDTLPERAYDALTLLAARMFDVPITFISLIGAERQWFKSRIGLEAAESPRDLAFCAYTIMDTEPMVVPDTVLDQRFVDNPFVTAETPIRFYAGVPLVTESGSALGTMCVIDYVPREFTPDQQEALSALATQVMALFELRRTIQDLQRSQDLVESAMRQRETFMATVSHEIRTPLSTVVGSIDLLTDPLAELSRDEREEMLAMVGRQATDVSHLIDDLLVAAKAEAGSLRVQQVPVNLAAQTAQVLEGLDPELAVGVAIDALPCRAVGDPARVRQVVRNLLTNAFRYGGPTVSVSIRAIGDRCSLQVIDDGPGVPLQDLESIFEPFRQAQSDHVISDSVGLGLPISRVIAERMGGDLHYERRGDRTFFTLELPAGSPS